MQFAQKYRPDQFSKMVGHKKIVDELKKYIVNGDIPQTMLFHGVSGTGKTTIARLMGKAILCGSVKDGEPCNVCDICKAISREEPMLHYREYNASNLDKDSMREIEESASKVSMGLSLTNKKIFYIDELQELKSNKAAMKNALKVLERPMPGTYFILGAMDIKEIPSSLLDRCAKYKLNPLPFDEMLDYLGALLISEKVIDPSNVDENKLNVLTSLIDASGGSLRNVLSNLDRVVNGNLWSSIDIAGELGIVTTDIINDTINGIMQGDLAVMERPLDEEVYKQLCWRLNLLYKYNAGVELGKWEQGQLRGIKTSPLTTQQIQNTLTSMLDLLKFTYLTKDLISCTVLTIVLRNKELNNPPRRTRRD